MIISRLADPEVTGLLTRAFSRCTSADGRDEPLDDPVRVMHAVLLASGWRRPTRSISTARSVNHKLPLWSHNVMASSPRGPINQALKACRLRR